MGSSLPNFGSIDLDLVEEAGPSPATHRRHTPSFGELDLASIGAVLADESASTEASTEPSQPQSGEPQSPGRYSYPPLRETPTRESLEAVKLAEEETRIAKAEVVADALSLSRDIIDSESATRVGFIEESSPSARRNAPSASGVASRDDRVAAMRELYAQGNADAALALASEVASEIDAMLGGDPYGGLIPVVSDDDSDEDGSEAHTAIVEASADSSRLAAMTSRQVPRLLVGPKEIAKLPMDPRAAFILGHIDGIQSMEEILDVCAMPEADALELVERLRAMGVIALH
ncbi:MAG: hypothetical protein BGO98_31835 [Myxococcales bacterium 68-20]|nr:hypothetical protein [Myxococcales bacterium]OJY18339.1 MAG: hypothetical protein BGO98_31835 [Myxococcales bacterium 68-20]